MLAHRVWLVLGLVCLAGFWFDSSLTAQAQAPITLDEYQGTVAQSLALAQQAQLLATNERAPLLESAANMLDAIHEVQTPSGAIVRVDNAELVALVRDPAHTGDAVARLDALQAALAEPLATINPADLTALRELLNRPPFVQATERTWWQNLLLQILDFIERLFTNTTRGVFDLRDLLILAAVLVVIAVLFYFIRNLRRNLVSEEILPTALMEQEARTPGEAFDSAQRYINAGDLRSAVRQLYLATLLLLDRHGRIKYDPTLTNREYLHQAQNDPRTTAALQPIVETFDRTWYGFEPISARDFDEYRQRVENIKNLQ